MIDAILKRPFARPLLFWITGICLYVLTPYEWIATALLLFAASFLLLSGKDKFSDYSGRWHWGVLVSMLIVSLSVLMCAAQDLHASDADWQRTVMEKAASVRSELLGRLDRLRLAETEKDVLGTMLLGGASTIDREVRMQFSLTGVAHILSVSGFHVAVVCGFFTFLLKPLPSAGWFRWLRYSSTMLVLWGFTIVSGLEPASVRSALMLSFFLTGRFVRRDTDGYNTLAASAFFMLVFNPFYLFDIGFQLSYVAVWFILLLKPPLDRLLELKNPLFTELYSLITVSVAAQAGSAFLCLYYFSQFPVLFLLTNLPFSLVCMLLIPAGLIYILIPESLPLPEFAGGAIEGMTTFLLYIVQSFSVFPWAAFILPFDFFDLLLSYAFLLFLTLFIYRKRPQQLILSCSFLAVLLLKFLLETLWLPS